MIIAIVGFIFACIPGALIVGWLLLPIAFILGIVAVFLKGGEVAGDHCDRRLRGGNDRGSDRVLRGRRELVQQRLLKR